jgi:Mg-chelatase subunit ChlD
MFPGVCSRILNSKWQKKGAIDFASDALIKRYAVGLIKFGDKTTHICEPTTDLNLLKRLINTIDTEVYTNMMDAIILATEKLVRKLGFKVMVIATDGRTNNPDTTTKAAIEAKRFGVDIITIGTDDADVDFLKQISSRNNLNVMNIMVSVSNFAIGIKSTSQMLPQIKKGD